jgi:hypothetical protein
MSYKIIRSYANEKEFPPEVLETGLSLDEAQVHCKDPETSSRTCQDLENVARTQRCGPWFDVYDEE